MATFIGKAITEGSSKEEVIASFRSNHPEYKDIDFLKAKWSKKGFWEVRFAGQLVGTIHNKTSQIIKKPTDLRHTQRIQKRIDRVNGKK